MSEKFTYEEFLASVAAENQGFVSELHGFLTQAGCTIDVKLAKSGYMVSYAYEKKSLLNYVLRKKGTIARIYANHIGNYAEILNGFPADVIGAVRKAPICKRLAGTDPCNSKCAMGYDFSLDGEHLQKCRYNAFMITVNGTNYPFIRAMLENELKYRQTVAG